MYSLIDFFQLLKFYLLAKSNFYTHLALGECYFWTLCYRILWMKKNKKTPPCTRITVPSHTNVDSHTFTLPLVQYLPNCSYESPNTWQVCTFQKSLPVTSTGLPFIYLHIQCDYLPLRNCCVPVSPVRGSGGGLRLLWALAPTWLSGGGALRARQADAQCCWGNRCPEGRP